MATFLLIIHIMVSFLLIFIVLIQGGKGAEMGAAFGGGSGQTVFGSRGATTFLSKMTTVVAVLFMITSLLLAMSSVKSGGSSIIKQDAAPASQGATPTGQSAVPPSGTGSSVPQTFVPQTDSSTPPARTPVQTPAGQ